MNEVNLLMKCSICGKRYGNRSVRVVQNKRDSMLIHVNCSFCRSSSLAVVNKGIHNNDNIVTLGILTDLDYDESCNLLKNKPVSADEVLDLYKRF